jgi:hypothetical protein
MALVFRCCWRSSRSCNARLLAREAAVPLAAGVQQVLAGALSTRRTHGGTLPITDGNNTGAAEGRSVRPQQSLHIHAPGPLAAHCLRARHALHLLHALGVLCIREMHNGSECTTGFGDCGRSVQETHTACPSALYQNNHQRKPLQRNDNSSRELTSKSTQETCVREAARQPHAAMLTHPSIPAHSFTRQTPVRQLI